jgi:uncharacterized membrane protein
MVKRFLSGLLLFLIVLFFSQTPALAQDKALIWDRYDVNITVQPNSDMQIEEIQAISFTSGTFTFGFAAIPLDRVENLTDIRVFEQQGDRLREYAPSASQQPYTFTTFVENNEQIIRWYFPPTANSTHIFELHYRVQGGLRIYEGGDQVCWKAIATDHNFPIRHSLVRVNLPASFNPDQLVVQSYGAEAASQVANGSTVVFNAANIPADQELEVRVQFPHGIVQGEAPAWQSADDRQRELQERFGPILDLGFIVLGMIALFGGPLGVYALWYVRGRDEPAGIIADTIPEPPSDLPPGAAGTLVDEQADLQDILATLVDLARRGAIYIEEKHEEGFLGIGSGWEFIFHLENREIATRPYEKKLIQKIFGREDTSRRLSDLREQFYTIIPELKKHLYAEVVRAGYFPSNPDSTRRKYKALGWAGLILSLLVGGALFVLTAAYSGMATCLIFGLAVTMISFIIVGRHMPRKTRLGAEEAAKWRAFKNYLKNVEKYGDLEEAKAQFDQFLPYAVAFGIDRSLIRQFSKIDAPAPTWYGPVYYPGRHYHHGTGRSDSGEGRTAPGPLAGEGGRPTLSEMSQNIGTSLSSMSAGLGAMLTSASRTFTSTPAPQGSGGSGGGFSGGGFSGGGGGGGGSRGFG